MTTFDISRLSKMPLGEFDTIADEARAELVRTGDGRWALISDVFLDIHATITRAGALRTSSADGIVKRLQNALPEIIALPDAVDATRHADQLKHEILNLLREGLP